MSSYTSIYNNYNNLLLFLIKYTTKDLSMPVMNSSLWASVFDIAAKQSVTGVIFEAIKELPIEEQPKKEMLLKWYARCEQIRKTNIKVNIAATRIYNFFKDAGFDCCILKGQGNAAIYDMPYSRMPGDIDIWINADRKIIMDFVKRNFKCGELRFNHIELEMEDGIPVEVHFFPLYVNNPIYNARLQKWFKKNAETQCNNIISLPDEAGRISIPTPEFNAVYQMGHIFHHFFDEGIGLRQLMDYCYVLKNMNPESKREVAENLRTMGLRKFAEAVMYVLKEVFGLEEDVMPVKPDNVRGKRLLAEIMDGGNFGRFYTKYGEFSRKGTAQKYFLKIYRNMHFVKEYPTEALCEPVFRTWHFFWRIINRN